MKITIKLFLLSLALVLWSIAPVYAGSSFTALSQTTNVIAIKNAEEMSRIIEQIIEARKATQKALSKEEIERIKERADEVLHGQTTKGADDAGAMVYVGSEVIK